MQFCGSQGIRKFFHRILGFWRDGQIPEFSPKFCEFSEIHLNSKKPKFPMGIELRIRAVSLVKSKRIGPSKNFKKFNAPMGFGVKIVHSPNCSNFGVNPSDFRDFGNPEILEKVRKTRVLPNFFQKIWQNPRFSYLLQIRPSRMVPTLNFGKN